MYSLDLTELQKPTYLLVSRLLTLAIMQKLLLSMSLFTCYLRLLENVVLYRSGGGELIPWCPEVVLYIIQPVKDP